MLSDEARALVEESYRDIGLGGKLFVLEFYDNLFMLAPGIRTMFPGDLGSLAKKLGDTLDTTVEALYRLDGLLPRFRALGEMHANLGTQREHYTIFADALVKTFADRLGDTWRPEHEAAWRELLAIVAAAMLDGAENPAQPRQKAHRNA